MSNFEQWLKNPILEATNNPPMVTNAITNAKDLLKKAKDQMSVATGKHAIVSTKKTAKRTRAAIDTALKEISSI